MEQNNTFSKIEAIIDIADDLTLSQLLYVYHTVGYLLKEKHGMTHDCGDEE